MPDNNDNESEEGANNDSGENNDQTNPTLSIEQFQELLDNSDTKLHRDARHIVHCIETAVELRIQADKIRKLGEGNEVCDDQLEVIEESVKETRRGAEAVWPVETMPDLIQLAEGRFNVVIDDGDEGGDE